MPIYRLFILQRKPKLGGTKPLTGLHVARGLGITRIDGHSRVAEDVTLGSSTMNHLLITANLVLLESSEQGLLHPLICFLLRATKPEMKSAQKMSEVLCLSRIIRQFRLQVSGNTLQQVEKFKYIGVVFTRDERRRQNKEIDTRIGKANTVLWSQNGSFQTPQSCHFFQAGFCSDLHLWSWILGNDRKNINLQ